MVALNLLEVIKGAARWPLAHQSGRTSRGELTFLKESALAQSLAALADEGHLVVRDTALHQDARNVARRTRMRARPNAHACAVSQIQSPLAVISSRHATSCGSLWYRCIEYST